MKKDANVNDSGNQQNKWKVFIKLGALIATISFAIWAVSGYVAYPSAEHRAVAREINQLTSSALKDNNFASIVESSRYKELEKSKQAQYSALASFVTTAVGLVVSVALVVYAYLVLRRDRITETPVRATALINATAASLLVPLTILFDGVFYPGGSDAFGIPYGIIIAFSVPLTFGLVFLVSYVAARITQWYYNRKYGFTD